MTKKINIGITVQIKDPKTTKIFSNGIRQNIFLLQELFEKCKNVENSYIINTAEIDSYKDTQWEPYSNNIITRDQAETMCDLIIICHGGILETDYIRYADKGIKLVNLILGAELSIFNETILFKDTPVNLYKRNNLMDAVWISPHFFERDKYFQEVLNDCPVYLANYIWDARFIEKGIKDLINLKETSTGLYQPSNNQEKRIASLEPNINFVKTSTVPLVTAELFYREYPHLVDSYNIFGGLKVSHKKDVKDFISKLDIAKRCYFEGRYPVVWTMNKHTDILLCHQNQCELNYLYLDVAWMGYPVIHNSPMMKDLGWYYPENDSATAIKHLKYVCEQFDTKEHPNNKYLEKSRKFAYRYSPSNPENIKAYEDLIEKALVSSPKQSISISSKPTTTTTIRIISECDGASNDYMWGDYWVKRDLEIAFEKRGYRVIKNPSYFSAPKEVADIDLFYQTGANPYYEKFTAKIQMTLIDNQSKALTQQHYYKKMDHIFSFSKDGAKKWKELGVSSSFVPVGRNTLDYNTINNIEKKYDLTLVGIPRHSRREIIRSLIKAGIKNIAIYGAGWNKYPEFQNQIKGEYYPNDKLLDLYASSKINIALTGDTQLKNKQITVKALTIMSAGQFLLYDNIHIKDYVPDAICFESTSDLVAKVKYYLNNPAERVLIAEKCALQCQEYTFDKTCNEMDKIIMQKMVYKKE